MEPSITKTQNGFAMLFTVLLVGLILSIAIGISNITLKQAILSNLAKDSGTAFYQADAAVDCGMYQDTKQGGFPKGATIATVAQNFTCGPMSMLLDQKQSQSQSQSDYFVYTASVGVTIQNKPCATIIIDKTGTTFKVRGIGYNICTSTPINPRRVERTLEVSY